MAMLNTGLNKIRDLHKANIDKAWLGTDSTAYSESQTGLISGVSATKKDVVITSSDKTNMVEYTLTSAYGTGNTYREFSVIKDGVVEYNRVVTTGLQHTSSEDIIIQTVFTYKKE